MTRPPHEAMKPWRLLRRSAASSSPCPRHVRSLAASFEHFSPDSPHAHTKVTDRNRVHRHRIVAHVPNNHRPHIASHLGNGRVHASPEFGFNCLELGLPALAHRLPP